MKIAFIGSRYYNSDPSAGASYEYSQVAGTLLDLGLPVLYLDSHRPNLQGRLERAAKEVDVIFFNPAEWEYDWHRLSDFKQTKIALLSDDEWRREYGLKIAPFADLILTTARDGARAYGDKYVPFQWGARLKLYSTHPATIPISFVGLNYGYRGELVKFIEGLGLPVKTYGKGWGRTVTEDQIAATFASSKMSLTTSQSSDGKFRQIKARVFEIPASGALLVAEYAPGLEDYYEPDKEAVFWEQPGELAEKLYYFMTHETERQVMAALGQRRTVTEHDYRKRFISLFKRLGILKELAA